MKHIVKPAKVLVESVKPSGEPLKHLVKPLEGLGKLFFVRLLPFFIYFKPPDE
jgi:hypothetical protein